MLPKKLKDVVEVGFNPTLKVTDETVEAIMRETNSGRGYGFGDFGSARFAMGKVMTDKEMKNMREKDYLPGESFYERLTSSLQKAYDSLANLLRR